MHSLLIIRVSFPLGDFETLDNVARKSAADAEELMDIVHYIIGHTLLDPLYRRAEKTVFKEFDHHFSVGFTDLVFAKGCFCVP